MKNWKNLCITGALALMVSLTTACAPALGMEGTQIPNDTPPAIKLPELENSAAAISSRFLSFTGTVIEIHDYMIDEKPAGDKFFLLLSGNEDALTNFVVSSDTCRANGKEPEVGETVTGWYDATLPAIMIYPPQYAAEAIWVGEMEDGQSIKADLFDSDLLSADGELKLNIGGDTQIVLEDGTAYDGELSGRRLIVIYSMATRSIPAQTTPEKIIVLFENAIAPVAPIEGIAEVIVNGKSVMVPEPYIGGDGILMVPVAAIAQALGYDALYNEDDMTMTLNSAAALTVGKDAYTTESKVLVSLGKAPELTNGEVYVPLKFFTEVLGMNNAYSFEGQIVIDNEEPMR